MQFYENKTNNFKKLKHAFMKLRESLINIIMKKLSCLFNGFFIELFV